MIDSTEIGGVTMQLIESIEEDYPDAELTRVVVIAQFSYRDDSGDTTWAVRHRGSDDPIASLGVADAVVYSIKAMSQG